MIILKKKKKKKWRLREGEEIVLSGYTMGQQSQRSGKLTTHPDFPCHGSLSFVAIEPF
jgi:hypothetical protein